VRRINLKKANPVRSDTIRIINRQIVLNYVRERAPLSRADIAHETNLQRSTVSLIVDELKGEGLIEEFNGESTGGRPPLLLQLRAAEAIALAVDLNIQSTIVVASDLAGRVLEQLEFKTDKNARRMLDQLISCLRMLLRKHRGIEGIGISLPGLVDPETGVALFIPHFKWRDWPVAEKVEAACGVPVRVDNDANAAALAELWFGRPEIREVRDFILVLVEDGLGTGIVFDGQVYRGASGSAGEFGHMTIGRGAPAACAAGSRECWEAFASERAALVRYARLTKQRNGDGRVKFSQLVDRALDGEGAARNALKETAYYLGVGISNLIKGLNPEVVIVCGQIARAWSFVELELNNAVEKKSLCRELSQTRIISSTLGENPRITGALSLILASKFASILNA
jgi:predicted NBD/HSP70 family sugar kinase